MSVTVSVEHTENLEQRQTMTMSAYFHNANERFAAYQDRLALNWNSAVEKRLQQYSLFSHAGVFQDVHVDEERLLVFTHPTQKQSSLLQQALGVENKVKGSPSTRNIFNAAKTLLYSSEHMHMT